MTSSRGIYLVGGSVRDELLGMKPKDYDYVVVGYTVEEFLAEHPDAKLIGQSFPVFMEKGVDGVVREYAFARTERKVSAGHNGFDVTFDPSVTLYDDLARRDLTINAMAKASDGSIVDYFGGQKDLSNRVLRHIGPAFAEDPLRVYRLARFASILGFQVAQETVSLCWTMSAELTALSAERVCAESRRVMRESHAPRVYFDTLLACGALGAWHHELLALVGVPAGPPKHHAELDAYVHTMMSLDAFDTPTPDVREGFGGTDALEILRWAVLLHDLGKGVTPKEDWPSHHDHDSLGVPVVEKFCDRLRLPKNIKKAAVCACAEHMRVHALCEMRATKWVDIVQAAEKTELGAAGLAAVCMADSFGRISAEPTDISGPRALSAIIDTVQEETGHPIPQALTGKHIGLHIRARKASAAKRRLKELGLL